MHCVHSIEKFEAGNGHKAVILKLGGNLDDSVEPVLRLEFDKTLIKARKAGVILDLAMVTKLCSAAIGRIYSFGRYLMNDHIPFVIVVPEDEKVSKKLVKYTNNFDLAPDIEVARAMLGIDEVED
ncbi:MAG: hypothetical protein WCP14_01860 [bacterium]